jgi:asparagine synthase (glutamine-hydrolysing)
MITTPEDHLDPPCVHDAVTDVIVAIDGYLSNRQALAAALSMSTPELRSVGDARLVARAFTRWGLDAFARLDGEFALVLWDVRARTCAVARDRFGIRPLYYSLDEQMLCVATELQALQRVRPSRVNEGMVAEALVWRRVSLDETLFTGIKRLPPRHLLLVQDTHSQVRRYWSPNLDRASRWSADDEYDEACRDHVRRAVRSVLRSDRPVGLMLSGGMDSGVIAAEAAQAPPPAATLQAFTVTFPGTDVDEGGWARETATHTGTPWTPVLPSARDYDFLAESRQTLQLPSYPSNANSVALRRAAVDRDSRILVTGMGGDEWFYGSNWRYADLLRRGRLWQWAGELRSDQLLWPSSWRRVLRDSVLPMVPRQRWRDISRVLGRVSKRGLIDEAWAKQVHLEDRLERDCIPAAGLHARRDIGREFHDGGAVAAHEEMAQLGALTGTVHRHPFYNRELVEFALALPEEQRRHRGVTKRILRRAYAAALPAGVISRLDSFTYNFLNTEVIRALLQRGLFRRPLVVAQGWVSEQPLNELIDKVSRGPIDGESADAAMQLWPTASVEVWLNSVLR